MADIKRVESMWATMEPDMYGGPNCDKLVPRWRVYAVGDKQDDTENGPLALSPRHFPPGTKIVVSEPTCPNCDETREPGYPIPKRGPVYKGKCRCGFDWDNWAAEQYS